MSAPDIPGRSYLAAELLMGHIEISHLLYKYDWYNYLCIISCTIIKHQMVLLYNNNLYYYVYNMDLARNVL